MDEDYTIFAMTEKTYVYIGINSKNEFYYNFDVTNEYKYAGNCLKSILAKVLFEENPWQ
jgi:hypothetical protein